MAVTTNGADFKRFYADPAFWPEDAYHDEAVVLVNGDDYSEADKDLSAVADTDVIRIEGGYVVLPDDKSSTTLESYFRKWQRLQSMRTVLVEVNASKFDAVVAAVRAAGGKVK